MTTANTEHVHCFCQHSTANHPMCCKCGWIDLNIIRRASFAKLGDAYRKLAEM